jgi:hypothetical protein
VRRYRDRFLTVPVRLWSWLALAALSAGAAVGYAAYPTFPTYDTLYSLIWGREIAHGHLPSFEAYRAPTQHPLYVLAGTILTPFGHHADRLMIAITVASFVALVAALYRLGAAIAGPLVGFVAAGLTLTRLDFPYFAAVGYVDISYLACVFWAAALEAERPRRGRAVWVLLAMAGLLRPEGWLLLGVYVLWMGWRAPWADRVRYVAYAAVAPGIWVVMDGIATGNPLYSLTYTSRSAQDLGRGKQLSDLPSLGITYLSEITKPYLLVAAAIGAVLAWRLGQKRFALVGVLFVCGVASWFVIATGGLATVYRYMALAGLAALLPAAFALGGFTALPIGSGWRRAWMAGSAFIVFWGIVFTAGHLSTRHIRDDLRLRHDAHTRLVALLKEPKVAAARRCGPIALPNQKAVPDVRWEFDLPDRAVIARSDPNEAAHARRGLEIMVIGELFNHPAYGPLVQPNDSPLIAVPGAGFRYITHNTMYAAYERC